MRAAFPFSICRDSRHQRDCFGGRGAAFTATISGRVLSHDPQPPVIRRKMAFHDALYDDGVAVEGIAARRADTGLEIRSRLAQTDPASPSPSSDCST